MDAAAFNATGFALRAAVLTAEQSGCNCWILGGCGCDGDATTNDTKPKGAAVTAIGWVHLDLGMSVRDV